MDKITFEFDGKKVFCTGSLYKWKQIEVSRRVAELGGEVVKKFGEHVDYLFIGDWSSKEELVTRAEELGIQTFIAGHAKTFLREGKFEMDKPLEVAHDDLEGMLAVFKELLATTDSFSETWKRLTTLVDELDPSILPEVADALTPMLEAWERGFDPMSRESDRAVSTINVYGYYAGRARSCSKVWFDSPDKARLTSSYWFGPKDDYAKILAHPSLLELDTITLGSGGSKKFYEAVCRSKNLGNIKTLVLNDGRKSALKPLLGATSLAHIERLFLTSRTAKNLNPDHSSELITGPWADNLETLSFGCVEQLSYWAAHRDQLPALRELIIPTDVYAGEGQYQELADLLRGNLTGITTLHLHIHHVAGLQPMLDLLDDASATSLTHVYVNAGQALALGAEDVSEAIERALGDEALVKRLAALDALESLRFDSGFQPRALDALSAAGAPASIPGSAPRATAASELQEEQQEQLEHTTSDAQVAFPAVGGAVTTSDAQLTLAAPDWRTWDTIVGIVDALLATSTPEQFASDVSRIAEYLEQWPDHARRCPEHWYSIFFKKEKDPRLDLIRALTLQPKRYGADSHKSEARLIDALAESSHLGQLTSLSEQSFKSQKFVIKALVNLFDKVRPQHVHLGHSHASKTDQIPHALAEAGLIPEQPEATAPRQVPTIPDATLTWFSEAYTAEQWFPQQWTHQEIIDFVATPGVRVGKLHTVGFQRADTCPTISELVTAMHPDMRESVHTLEWPLQDGDLQSIDKMCKLLPNLSVWIPTSGDLEQASARKPLLEVIAATPSTRQLGVIHLFPKKYKLEALKKKEFELLDKGEGLPALRLGMSADT